MAGTMGGEPPENDVLSLRNHCSIANSTFAHGNTQALGCCEWKLKVPFCMYQTLFQMAEATFLSTSQQILHPQGRLFACIKLGSSLAAGDARQHPESEFDFKSQ